MVRMMFDMYVNQGIGCTTIAATLNRMGAVPRRGGPFNRSTVSVILKNPVYCGKIARNKTSGRAKTRGGKKGAVYHPQADWELFDGIHHLSSSRRYMTRPKSFSPNDITHPTQRVMPSTRWPG